MLKSAVFTSFVNCFDSTFYSYFFQNVWDNFPNVKYKVVFVCVLVCLCVFQWHRIYWTNYIYFVNRDYRYTSKKIRLITRFDNLMRAKVMFLLMTLLQSELNGYCENGTSDRKSDGWWGDILVVLRSIRGGVRWRDGSWERDSLRERDSWEEGWSGSGNFRERGAVRGDGDFGGEVQFGEEGWFVWEGWFVGRGWLGR